MRPVESRRAEVDEPEESRIWCAARIFGAAETGAQGGCAGQIFGRVATITASFLSGLKPRRSNAVFLRANGVRSNTL